MNNKKVLLLLVPLVFMTSCSENLSPKSNNKESKLEKEIATIKEEQENLQSQVDSMKKDKKELQQETEGIKEENLLLKKKNEKLAEDLKKVQREILSQEKIKEKKKNKEVVEKGSSKKIDTDKEIDQNIPKEAKKPEDTEEEVAQAAEKNTEISFFLVSPNIDDMSGDISRYLMPVELNLDLDLDSAEKKIKHALDFLFSIKDHKYGPDKLQNNLHFSSLILKKIQQTGKTIIIDLEGKIIGIGSMTDVFTKKQITKTIEQYTDSYIVRLNGSESEWRCSLDKSGMCQ